MMTSKPEKTSSPPSFEDLTRAVDRMRTQNGPQAILAALRAASQLVEHAAYESAHLEGPHNVAALILIAADIERAAQSFAQTHAPGPA